MSQCERSQWSMEVYHVVDWPVPEVLGVYSPHSLTLLLYFTENNISPRVKDVIFYSKCVCGAFMELIAFSIILHRKYVLCDIQKLPPKMPSLANPGIAWCKNCFCVTCKHISPFQYKWQGVSRPVRPGGPSMQQLEWWERLCSNLLQVLIYAFVLKWTDMFIRYTKGVSDVLKNMI